MNKAHWLLAPVALLALTTAQAQDDIPGPAVGEAFPHMLEAPDQNGVTKTFSDLAGEPLRRQGHGGIFRPLGGLVPVLQAPAG